MERHSRDDRRDQLVHQHRIGSEPLELLVVAVPRDIDAKAAVMRGAARP